MGFHFLWINVIFFRKDNDVLASSGDRKITVAVNETQVTGSKPTFFDRFGRFIRRSIITFHHDRSANQHFSYALLTWILDADRYTANRSPNGSEAVVLGRCDGRSRRGL